MKRKDVTRKEVKKQKFRGINIRVNKELKDWLIQGRLSPTLIFRAACKELGYKE